MSIENAPLANGLYRITWKDGLENIALYSHQWFLIAGHGTPMMRKNVHYYDAKIELIETALDIEKRTLYGSK